MHIILAGLNHKSAPVAVRERLALGENELPEALAALGKLPFIHERVILSTCNRVEFYATTEDVKKGMSSLVRFLHDYRGLKEEELEHRYYCHTEPRSVHHAFCVASSLDSMVVGEAQIIAQVKAAYQAAWENGATKKILNQLFQHALGVAKTVRSSTDIARWPVSVGSVAAELAKKIFGDLKDKKTLILGAGKMSELAATCLARPGSSTVLVANRTFSRAQEIAEKLGGRAVRFEDYLEEMVSCDIIISSTAAAHFILKKEDLKSVLIKRRNHPLFIIDIAVPRDVDPEVGRIDNVYLYNIDDLEGIAGSNREQREQEMGKCSQIIHTSTEQFMIWLSSIEVTPTISQLTQRVEGILRRELARARGKRKLQSATGGEEIGQLARRLARSILARPITHLKRAAGEGNGTLYTSALQELFELEETAGGKESPPADQKETLSSDRAD